MLTQISTKLKKYKANLYFHVNMYVKRRAVAGGGPPGLQPGPKRKILRGADLGKVFLILYLKKTGLMMIKRPPLS
jgi:hypothetical protein